MVVGADRIAANGDMANKIGTYPLAVLAARHGMPFYVAAPVSTIDLGTPTGEDIPIEERDPAEVGRPAAPRREPGIRRHPAELVAGDRHRGGCARTAVRGVARRRGGGRPWLTRADGRADRAGDAPRGLVAGTRAT